MARWRRSVSQTAPRWEQQPDGEWHMEPLPGHGGGAAGLAVDHRAGRLARRLGRRVAGGGVAVIGLIGVGVATGNWILFGPLAVVGCLTAAIAPAAPDPDPPGGSYAPPTPPQVGGFGDMF